MFVVVRRKYIFFAIAGMLLLLLGCVFFVQDFPKVVETAVTDWGLSFQEQGKAPIGNADAAYLKEYNAYYTGDTTQKKIYLTFDAGYENGYTPCILETLKKHNVKAAFFVVGNYIETSPELIKQMVQEGHIVGNHTYSHPDMSKIADMSAFQNEIEKLEGLYQETTGKPMPKFYRPPQGKFSEINLQMAKDLGYHTMFWSLAYVDWYVNDQPTREEALQKLTDRIHNGAIVLLHSTSQTNAEILDELLSLWKNAGYQFDTLDKLVAS